MSKCKIGDRVVVTAQHNNNIAKVGTIGLIVAIDMSTSPYLIELEDGSQSWCKDVELVAAKSEMFPVY